MSDQHRYEHIGNNVWVCVSNQHTFGTDSFMLSYFARPKIKEQVCDFGSGCGIIPLLWFRGDSGPRHVYALDIQQQAIQQLEQSLLRSQLEQRITPLLGDLRDIQGLIAHGSLDLVTCNPPYKAANTGVVSQEDSQRIARHETLCTLQDVCRAAAWVLRFGGRLCVCQLPERLPDVMQAMRDNGIEPKRLRFVQQNIQSAPWLVLVEGRLGGRPFLQVEPALLMEHQGTPTPELEQIYSLYGKL